MSKRILIVEDEEAIAKMIALNLRVANMEPVIFYDGNTVADALDTDHNFDLALLDIMVPGKDGFELQQILKNYGIPVIFLTAKSDVISKVKGLRDGAEDYITKPFEVLELLVRIEKVLERTQKSESFVKFGNLDVNFAERTVKQHGQEIILKPLEFDLFAVLLKNKNIAISREDLLSLVWGSRYMGETRTVDVHIGQIRKKLGLHEQIKTVSKFGYRLEEL